MEYVNKDNLFVNKCVKDWMYNVWIYVNFGWFDLFYFFLEDFVYKKNKIIII